MNIAISLGNRALYAVYPDRSGSKRIVQNGSLGYFDMHLWCNGKQADFGVAALRQSVINYSLFFPDLIIELRKPATKRTKFSFGKVKLGLSGMLALLFKDVRQKILADLLRERLIHMVSEPLLLTLVLPDDIHNELPEAKELIVSSFKAAGFQIKTVIPEYVAAVYAYNLNVNRSCQSMKVLQIDIGDRAKIKYIEINEDGNIKLIASQYADIGIRPIENMLKEHIDSEFRQHNYTGHNNFPESLDQDERFDYEYKLAQFTNSLMVSTDESLRFFYSTKQNESVELDIEMNPRDAFVDVFEMKFVFPTRIMNYLSSLSAATVNFMKNNGIDHTINKLAFSGAGCRFPSLVDELQKILSGGAKTQLLRKDVDYSSVLAFGGSAYNDANDYESEYHHILSDEERKLSDQIHSVITEPWIIPTNPAEIMEPDVRYQLTSDANHIRIDFSDKERISTKIELIIDGAKQRFDLNSGKQPGVECLDLNQYHICLSELKSNEVYFVAESDTELSNLDFFLDISDLLKDSFHHTLDSHHINSSHLKFNKIRLLKLYQHAGKWRITACLEPLDASFFKLPPSKKSDSPQQNNVRVHGDSIPAIQPKAPKSDGGLRKMLEGERVQLQDSKYQIEINGSDYTLFTQLFNSDEKGQICTSKTQSLEMAVFNSENSLILSLNLLERHKYKRALICLAASGTTIKGMKFSCTVYSLGSELQNLSFDGTTNFQYSKVLEFYQKDGKWRMLGVVEKLPDDTVSSGISENSNLSNSGSKPDNLVSGEKFTLPKELKLLRVDFVGSITTNLNLVLYSLDVAERRVPVWKLEKNAQIINQSERQKAISLLFDLSRLMLDQYICVSNNCLNFLDSLTFLDGETHKPIKSALRQGGSCLNNCSYLFKLYKYKGVWKIGYLCD